MTVTVAVTGGIGAGKSTVSGLLAARGAIVVDSDRLAREVVGPGTAGLSAVVEEFGPGVRSSDGSLDRKALASIVFSDAAARRRLEHITHPAIRARFAQLQAAAPPGSVVVNDIPLLTSAGAAAAFHLVIGVGAPDTIRLERLVARGLAEQDARARIAAQITDQERRPLCDVWVDNAGGPGEMRKRADLLFSRLAEYADNVRAARPAARGGPRLVPYDPEWPHRMARLRARLHHLVGAEHQVEHIGSTAVVGMAAREVLDVQLAVTDLAEAEALADVLSEGGFPRLPAITSDTSHPDTELTDTELTDTERTDTGLTVTERTETEVTGLADAGPVDTGVPGAGWAKRLHANADPGQSVNLHLRVRDSVDWLFALRFRDWLRAEAGAAREYSEIKHRLAQQHGGDASIDASAQAKEEFLERAGRLSSAWAASISWQPD